MREVGRRRSRPGPLAAHEWEPAPGTSGRRSPPRGTVTVDHRAAPCGRSEVSVRWPSKEEPMHSEDDRRSIPTDRRLVGVDLGIASDHTVRVLRGDGSEAVGVAAPVLACSTTSSLRAVTDRRGTPRRAFPTLARWSPGAGSVESGDTGAASLMGSSTEVRNWRTAAGAGADSGGGGGGLNASCQLRSRRGGELLTRHRRRWRALPGRRTTSRGARW